MKKLTALTALLLAALICLSGLSALAEVKYVTTTSLNVRSGPGTAYKRVATLPKGANVGFLESAKDASGIDWYRIAYGNVTGWVSSVYLSAGNVSAGSGTTTGQVNLRSGAGLNYSSLGTVPKGVTLHYDAYASDSRGVMWYHVTYNGQRGWLSSNYFKLSGYAPTPKPVGGSSVTTTASVNMRTGAGLGYATITYLPKGVTVDYDTTSTDGRGVVWYRVTYKGTRGWISSVYTNKGGSSSARKIVTTGSVNMRTGAGLNYATAGSVPKGVTLTYDSAALDGRGVMWYRVSYNGKTGWISSKYTRVG